MNQNKFFLCCLLCLGFGLSAQDTIRDAYEEPVWRSPGRFYLGGFLSPDLSYSQIPRNDQSMPLLKDGQANYDIPKFSVTVGAEALYQFNPYLSLSLGLQYSGKGGKTKDMQPLVSPVDSFPASMYYVYDYRYIDVPLRLDVYLGRGKVVPFITAGASAGIFIAQRSSLFAVDRNDQGTEYTDGSSSGFAAIVPQYQVGAGIDIALRSSRIRIFPVYRSVFTGTTLGATNHYTPGTVNGRLYSIGLGINCLLRL